MLRTIKYDKWSIMIKKNTIFTKSRGASQAPRCSAPLLFSAQKCKHIFCSTSQDAQSLRSSITLRAEQLYIRFLLYESYALRVITLRDEHFFCSTNHYSSSIAILPLLLYKSWNAATVLIIALLIMFILVCRTVLKNSFCFESLMCNLNANKWLQLYGSYTIY